MEHIAIIGAGTMGHALAAVFSMGGHTVSLYDTDAKTLNSATDRILNIFDTINLSNGYEHKLENEDINRITLCHNLPEAVINADIVLEAIIESPKVKSELYEKLISLMRKEAILASNSSHLDIFKLIPKELQSRSIITHWYTPPYIIDLVDVVPGPETEQRHTKKIVKILENLKKEPLVFKEFLQGYIANRVQSAINAEVCGLLDTGLVTPKDIDISIREGLALRMLVLGVLAKADFTDLNLMDSGLRNKKNPIESKIITELLKKGDIGIKSGKGFYDWGNEDVDVLSKDRDLRLLKIKSTLADVKMMLGK
ncbi:3-hydroxyacyl-CoA dehydrogenase family protein [Paenalcaligenes sp. Me131]|uniref:3-hydroxyacyl-CoA dehydrogenase family protein n=1 Tax=Paenalcaligenes sp. Me131 TaxID=3392636 RepID=UPI003D277213